LGLILILSFHVRLDLSSGLFPSGFPTKILCSFLTLPWVLHALYISSSIFFTLITFHEAYKLWSPSLCSLLHPPSTSFVLVPNILFSTLFSNAFSLRSSLSVWDQVSHLYKTKGRFINLCLGSKFCSSDLLAWAQSGGTCSRDVMHPARIH
jgi:hypothetical protein